MDITMNILIQEEETKVELYLLRVYEWKDEANYVTTKMLFVLFYNKVEANYVTTKMLFVLFYNKVKRKLFIEGLTSSMLTFKTANIAIEMN